jgi:hypothetical protein
MRGCFFIAPIIRFPRCHCEPPHLFFGGEAISDDWGIASGKEQERPRKDIISFVYKPWSPT